METHPVTIQQAVLAMDLDGNGFTQMVDLLKDRKPDDIEAMAAIRYLFHKRLWNHEDPDGREVIARFYSSGASALSPEEYRDRTGLIIQASYDFEMPPFEAYVPPPRVERDVKPQRKTKQRAVERHDKRGDEHHVTDLTEGESGSRTFKSLADHDVDTQGASDRLKKVIGIQRGG